MKDSKKWTVAALLVTVFLFSSSVANAASITVVEGGTPVFFGGVVSYAF